MPVSTLAFVALTALLLTPALVQADRRVIIKHAYQLERAPEVQKTTRIYEALAAAYVVYDKCAKELKATDEEKAYVADKFTKVARQYQINYQDAYVSYVGASPSQALVDDIASVIKARQQKTVNNIAISLRKGGCNAERLRGITGFVKKLRAADSGAANDNSYVEPRVRF